MYIKSSLAIPISQLRSYHEITGASQMSITANLLCGHAYSLQIRRPSPEKRTIDVSHIHSDVSWSGYWMQISETNAHCVFNWTKWTDRSAAQWSWKIRMNYWGGGNGTRAMWFMSVTSALGSDECIRVSTEVLSFLS